MAEPEKTTYHSTRKQLQRVLRDRGIPDPKVEPFFDSLLVFRQAREGTPLDEIERSLAEIETGDERISEILRRRFWGNETIQQVAHHFNLSVDQVNRLQSDGLDALTRLIQSKEARLREAETRHLLESLPPSSYAHHFGQNQPRQKLLGMLQSQNEPWIIAVCGLGGIGKTALVDTVVREAATDFHYNEILWIRVPSTRPGGSTNSGLLVRMLAKRLLPEGIPTSANFRQLRNLLNKRPHLIILDNFEGELEGEWLEDLHGLTKPSRFLITSRNQPRVPSNIFVLKLAEMDLGSATQLIRFQAQISGLGESLDTQAGSIYRVVGGNPLALKLVVGLLHSWPLTQTLEALQKRHGKPSAELFDAIYQNAWSGLGSASRTVMNAMTLVGEEGASLEQLSAISKLDDANLLEGVKEAVARSLIEARGLTIERRYGIHQLTETFLAGQASTDAAGEMKLRVLHNLHFWEGKLRGAGASQVLSSDPSNLYRTVQFGLDHGHNEVCKKLLAEIYHDVLAKKLAANWIPVFEQTVEALPKAGLLNQLGSLYWQLEKPDQALVAFKEASRASKRSRAWKEHIGALIGISLVHWGKGDLRSARREINTAWQTVQRHKPSHPIAGRALAVMGVIAHASGNYATAVIRFRKAERHFTGYPASRAQLILNRGLSLQMRKQFREALKQYRRAGDALAGREQTTRENCQIELLRSCAYYQMGDSTNAEIALKRAAAMNPETDEDIRSQAFLESSLGRVYLSLGKKAEARYLFKSAARLWKKAGNPEIELNVLGLMQVEGEG